VSIQQQSTWNSRRKAAVGVLVVAGAALALDRIVFDTSGPGAASAQSFTIAPGSTEVRVNTTNNAKDKLQGSLAQRSKVASLSQRFDTVRSSAKAPPSLMFVAPLGFFPVVEQSHAAAPEQASTRTLKTPSVQLPKLTAIITGPNGGAILDGKLQRIGEIYQGVTLISVSDRSAVVRTSQSDVVLSIEDTAR